MEQYLKVGILSSTHGIRGEMKVFPTTDDPRRFDDLKEVFLQTKTGMMPVHITGAKYYKQMVILKFKEFDSINDIEPYKGCELYVSRDHAVPLGEQEYYVADLLGMEVVLSDGQPFGTLKDVMQTGANDVYVVTTPDHKEVLIPAIRQCIIDVDVEQSRMTVELLPGLLDL